MVSVKGKRSGVVTELPWVSAVGTDIIHPASAAETRMGTDIPCKQYFKMKLIMAEKF